MLVLGIILILIGVVWGYWSGKNSALPPGYRPPVFSTQLSGCMMLFIPFVLIVLGIYIIATL